MATQAPTGARPSVNPRIKCDIQVKRFVNEYPIRNNKAPGSKINVKGLSCHAAKANMSPAKIVPIQAVLAEMDPVINGRWAVLGLRASIQRSAMRLEPIASVRAATMATVIQKNGLQLGHPSAAKSIPK